MQRLQDVELCEAPFWLEDLCSEGVLNQKDEGFFLERWGERTRLFWGKWRGLWSLFTGEGQLVVSCRYTDSEKRILENNISHKGVSNESKEEKGLGASLLLDS